MPSAPLKWGVLGVAQIITGSLYAEGGFGVGWLGWVVLHITRKFLKIATHWHMELFECRLDFTLCRINGCGQGGHAAN